MKIKLRDMTFEQYEKWREKKCSFCASCIFYSVYCNSDDCGCWVHHKDLFSDKFLDQEIEIEDNLFLDDKEKIYLRKVIEPYRSKVESIEKIGSEYFDSDNDFIVIHLVEDSISLPILNTGFKFKGMKFECSYTLEELGL